MRSKVLFFLFILFFNLFSINTWSQSTYVEPVFSYSLGTNPLNYGVVNDETEVSADTSITYYTYTNTRFSLGDGKSYKINCGGGIKNYLGYNVALSYFTGKEKTIPMSSNMGFIPYSIYSLHITQNNIFSYSSFNITPSLTLSANRETWNPYCRLGIQLSYGKLKEVQDLNINNNLPGYIPHEEYVYTYIHNPRLIFGWTSAIGIEFTRKRMFNIFIEAENLVMNFSPKKASCVEYTYQDEDKLSELPANLKDIEFVDTYNESDQDPNSPGKELRQTYSLSNFSISVGIRLYFENF
jgi:hypothetical protein